MLNQITSYLEMSYIIRVKVTITLAAISRESWLTAAIKVFRGIYTSRILVAIVAGDAAFVDIYITCGEKII